MDILRKLVLGLLCLVLFLGPSTQLDRLLQGQEMKNGDQLVSDQGIFILGFFSLTNNNYYLGIWYNDNRARLENLAWIANRDTPIFNKSASLTIDDHGNLKISYNVSLSIIIYYGQEGSNTSAVLLDTGNFVLRELNSEGFVKRELWQSFDYPTHTLVPGMKLGVNWKTGHTRSLTSWRGVAVPDTGAFTFGLDPNHTNQLVISWRGNTYWASGSWNNAYFNSSPSRRLTNPYCNFTYISNEIETYFSYSTVQTNSPQVTIDYLGALSVDSGSTLVNCTSAFSYFSEGCVAKELPVCRSPNDTFSPNYDTWYNIEGLMFDEGDNLTLMDCEAKCLNNCSCVAYASTNPDAQTGCEIWSTTIPMSDVSIPRTIYFYDSEGERKMKQKMLLQELGGSAIPSTIHDKVKKQNNERQASPDLRIFSFESISLATSNFSAKNKLGEGGFGLVYKGKISNGQEIAIKRLSRTSGQGLIEFKNEAILISKLQHTNLVRLLGFCIQQEEKILIYEYMPNKSLDFFLFDSTKKSLLNWKKRFNIIEGIAQGLVYLHKYSRLRVIHRDLKASNILLDEDMNPKISDFGMARIFGLKGSEENTNRIVGTYGYMSPEYAMNGVVSIKTDVFSYGVLLLEIVSSKKNNSLYHSESPLNLIGYAWQLWNEGRGLELIDPTILDESCPPLEVLRCIHVGLLCVQDQASDRPTMLDVVTMLSNETHQLFPPKQPAFFINTVQEESSDVTKIKPRKCSINNVTITEMEAR
ncbi:hypothetical protein ACB092_05G077700 [Castanea dentata]